MRYYNCLLEIRCVNQTGLLRQFYPQILLAWVKTSFAPGSKVAKLYLEEHAPEVALLLTDITMPGEINGAGLANLVGERWPDKPVMVMSGYETPETSGVKHSVAFIKKPWAIGQLLDCVESAFKSKAPQLH